MGYVIIVIIGWDPAPGTGWRGGRTQSAMDSGQGEPEYQLSIFPQPYLNQANPSLELPEWV